MTKIEEETVTCAVCRNRVIQTFLSIIHISDSSSLDTRMSDEGRWYINFWVHECSSCGYCSSNIAQPTDFALEVVQSKDYQDKLNDRRLSRLANRYHCQSILHERTQNWFEVGRACLNAAWSCDDQGHEQASQAFRIKAAVAFQKAMKSGKEIAKDRETHYVMLVDILRRASQWNAALNYCQTGLKEIVGTIEHTILQFEKKLILTGDTGEYYIDDVNIPTFNLEISDIDDCILRERTKLFPRMKRLMLHRSKVTDTGLEDIGQLSSLVELDLSGTSITDAGVRHLKGLHNLNTLFLMSTKVGDAGLIHLHGLSQLRFVLLHHTNVTKTGMQSLRDALPEVHVSTHNE